MSDSGSENFQDKEIRLVISPEDAELIAVRVRNALTPDPGPPAGILSKLKILHTAVTDYWIWISLLFFLLAWYFFGANPLYPIKKWAAASKELDAQLAQFAFQEELSHRYLTIAKSFLDSGDLKDATFAFEQALKMNPNSREAQYGIMKSRLLADSAAGQLDSEVMRRRIALLEESDPLKQTAGMDAHVAYAKARFFRLLGEKNSVIRPLLETAVKSRPSFAAAHGELGLLALEEGETAAAIDAFTKAHTLAPHDPFYMGALAHAHGENGSVKAALAWATKAYKQDKELFTGFLALARLKLIYAAKFQWVKNACNGLAERYEAAGLSKKDKNAKGYFVRHKGHSYGIASWEAKKAYCAQLGLLAAHFRNGPGGNLFLLRQQLKDLWGTALEGRHVLPLFLIHDLEEIEGHNAPEFQSFKSDIKQLKAFAARPR